MDSSPGSVANAPVGGSTVKPDCSRYKKEVAGISDMKELAEMIGDLHYETFAELLSALSNKLHRDSYNDLEAGREKLAFTLRLASSNLYDAFCHVKNAWEISKTFME